MTMTAHPEEDLSTWLIEQQEGSEPTHRVRVTTTTEVLVSLPPWGDPEQAADVLGRRAAAGAQEALTEEVDYLDAVLPHAVTARVDTVMVAPVR